ncbi:DNA repair and recombination protein RAD54 [Biomphalaria glabrata]|nr:hypothetical protein BgiMline_020058 [Biomphalaria glabrata]
MSVTLTVVNRENVNLEEIDKSVKNRFKWAWLEEKDCRGHLFSSYIQKLEEPGVAWCILCKDKIKYGAAGRKCIKSHAVSKKHQSLKPTQPTAKSSSCLPAALENMKQKPAVIDQEQNTYGLASDALQTQGSTYFQEPSIIEDMSLKEIDKSVKNKFNWEWLEEKDCMGHFLSSYIRKLEEPGVAWCIICKEKIKYGTAGRISILKHTISKKHRSTGPTQSTVKSSSSLPFQNVRQEPAVIDQEQNTNGLASDTLQTQCSTSCQESSNRETIHLKEIDKSVKNRFKWEWLKEKDGAGQFLSSYIRKLKEPGVAWCLICKEKLKYGSGGKKSITRHALSKKHQSSKTTRSPAKSSSSLPAASQNTICKRKKKYGSSRKKSIKSNTVSTKNQCTRTTRSTVKSSSSLPAAFDKINQEQAVIDQEHSTSGLVSDALQTQSSTSRQEPSNRENISLIQIDKSVKNKFKWEWLEEKDGMGHFLSSYIRKLEEPGVAWCIVCKEKIKYGTAGRKSILNHTISKKHQSSKTTQSTVKSSNLPAAFQNISQEQTVIDQEKNTSESASNTLQIQCSASCQEFTTALYDSMENEVSHQEALPADFQNMRQDQAVIDQEHNTSGSASNTLQIRCSTTALYYSMKQEQAVSDQEQSTYGSASDPLQIQRSNISSAACQSPITAYDSMKDNVAHQEALRSDFQNRRQGQAVMDQKLNTSGSASNSLQIQRSNIYSAACQSPITAYDSMKDNVAHQEALRSDFQNMRQGQAVIDQKHNTSGSTSNSLQIQCSFSSQEPTTALYYSMKQELAVVDQEQSTYGLTSNGLQTQPSHFRSQPATAMCVDMKERVSHQEALLHSFIAEHSLPLSIAPHLVALAQQLGRDSAALSQLSLDQKSTSFKL